jgi:C4-dicarboxylate transporter
MSAGAAQRGKMAVDIAERPRRLLKSPKLVASSALLIVCFLGKSSVRPIDARKALRT